MTLTVALYFTYLVSFQLTAVLLDLAACYTWAFEAPSAADKRPPVPRAAHIVRFGLVTAPVFAPNPSLVTSPQLTTFIKIIHLLFENKTQLFCVEKKTRPRRLNFR